MEKMDNSASREMGQEAYKIGDYDLATFYYRQALKMHPEDYEMRVTLGSVLILQSNFDEAAKVYIDGATLLEKRGESNELLGNMHISLAEVYLRLHRFEESQAQLEIAGRTGANLAFLCEARGRGYNTRGEYDKAFIAYQEYINLTPTDQDGYLGLAEAHCGLKQYDLAAQSLSIAKSLAPDDYWVEIALGNLAMTLEDYKNALDHYKNAQDLDPHKPAVTFSIGRAYLMMQDYVSARKTFSLALERRPNDAGSLCGLAQAEIIEGNTRQAIALLKTAILIDPHDRSYYIMLYQAQKVAGKWFDAFRTDLQTRKLFGQKA